MEIPGYRDLTEIGRGRASVVYRAEQEQFGRTVAVKVLSVGLVEERLRRRFERECAATGRLTGHPNIVAVLDNGFTADGNPYLTTAYYAHGSLGDRLRSQGPLPVEDVLRIGVKVAGALEAVHHSEILHRDIKPSNLLESGYGEPALTGFGIAAIDPAQQAMTMAQSFAPMHTPPEVVLGEPATEASDTYQLGSTLYALLAGRAPFETGTDDGVFAMLSRVQTDEVPPIKRNDVPDIVVDALRVAMAKRPEDRYPGTGAFGARLQQLQLELGLPRTDLVVVVGAAPPDRLAAPSDRTVMLADLTSALADQAAAEATPVIAPEPGPPAPVAPPPQVVAPEPAAPTPPAPAVATTAPPTVASPPPTGAPAPTAPAGGAPTSPSAPPLPTTAHAPVPTPVAPNPVAPIAGGPIAATDAPRRSRATAVIAIAAIAAVLALGVVAFVITRL